MCVCDFCSYEVCSLSSLPFSHSFPLSLSLTHSLDADAVVRLSEDSFRCQIGGINFFGYKFVPILYLKVLVDPVQGKSTLNIYKIGRYACVYVCMYVYVCGLMGVFLVRFVSNNTK